MFVVKLLLEKLVLYHSITQSIRDAPIGVNYVKGFAFNIIYRWIHIYNEKSFSIVLKFSPYSL